MKTKHVTSISDNPLLKIRLLFILFIGASFYPTYAFVSPDIPMSNAIYSSVDKLSSFSCFPKDIEAIRPMTESHLEALLEGISDECKNEETLQPYVESIKKYLEIKKDKRGELRTTFYTTNSRRNRVLETDAKVNPILLNEQSKFVSGGSGLFLEPAIAGSLSSWAAFRASLQVPIFWSNEADGFEFDPSPTESYVKLGWNNAELTVGRFPIQFGQSISGNLLISDSSPVMFGAKLGNTSPVILPTFLKYFGPMQAYLSWHRLDDRQHFPNSQLITERIAFKPAYWFEFGMGQSIIIGGRGSPKASTLGYFSELFGVRSGNIDAVNYSNRNYVYDARLVIPVFGNLNLYHEGYVEDCCVRYWRDFSQLFGFKLPSIAGNKKISIGTEWLRTTEITYRNSTFTSGYEYDGTLLGSPLGPDATGIYGLLEYRFDSSANLKTVFAYEKRNRNRLSQGGGDISSIFPAVVSSEERYRLVSSYEKPLFKDIWLRSKLGLEYVDHYNYRAEDSRFHYLVLLELMNYF